MAETLKTIPQAGKEAAIRRFYPWVFSGAIKKIRSGGILFAFSCSQVVDTAHFRGAVLAAAIEAGRSIRILYQMTRPADHPMHIFHPEGTYLKGQALTIE